jgi:ribonuclease G
VAILEDGRAAECYIERRGHRSVVGHVWKGRVENVLAGMEAAFIEVGLDKNGFLHVDEVVALGVPKRKRQIADLLKRGDEILVQATKDPMGSKGARLTMQLSLA